MTNTEDFLKKQIYSNLLARKGSVKASTFKEFPEQIKITPDESDYENMYFSRFFVKKANDKHGVIVEVDIPKFNELRMNPFYTAEIMRWKIAGVMRSTYDEGILREEGVIDFNEKSYIRIKNKFPNIDERIKSLTEFYKQS
jgi:hypothetical protein